MTLRTYTPTTLYQNGVTARTSALDSALWELRTSAFGALDFGIGAVNETGNTYFTFDDCERTHDRHDLEASSQRAERIMHAWV